MDFETSRLKSLAISEAGLVFDPTTGSIYTSNQVGLSIIAGLKEGLSTAEIAERITERFEVDRVRAERDLFDFCGQLLDYEVISDV